MRLLADSDDEDYPRKEMVINHPVNPVDLDDDTDYEWDSDVARLVEKESNMKSAMNVTDKYKVRYIHYDNQTLEESDIDSVNEVEVQEELEAR